MEVTSIAIEQKRVEGILFDIAVHTNLTPDHLDFHNNFEEYKKAKLKLFTRAKKAVVNLDDEGMSKDILSLFKGQVITYSMIQKADVFAKVIKVEKTGTAFQLHVSGDNYLIKAPIHGDHNIANFLAAFSACLHRKISIQDLLKAANFITGPEGRFQLLTNYPSHQIILDYAHTPEALESLVKTVKNLPHKHLILMVTGVGLRDPKQRPFIRKAVDGKADEIVVTVDHPGLYNRRNMVDDVMKGFSSSSSVHVKLHRERGIHKALSLADKDDLIVFTGLGFSGYQVIGKENVPYCEYDVIHQYFEKEQKVLV